MFRVVELILVLIWILDILNINPNVLPFLQPYLGYVLNDSNGLNTLFWLIVWCFLPSYNNSEISRYSKDK